MKFFTKKVRLLPWTIDFFGTLFKRWKKNEYTNFRVRIFTISNNSSNVKCTFGVVLSDVMWWMKYYLQLTQKKHKTN